MPDNLFLSNEAAAGYGFNENSFTYAFANESSALTGSASLIPVGAAKRNGRIVDFFIGVATPGTSASGWVSGTVTATVNINSATALSTEAAIAGAGSAGAAVRKSTNAGGGVSAVINAASAVFSAGDQISISYNARSVGSAAAGAAGTGLVATVVVRYAAA